MRWPLVSQILLPMVGILLLTVGAASALGAWLAAAQVQKRIEEQLADVAQTISASNFPLESGVLRQTHGLTGAEYVLTDNAGNFVAASNDELAPLARSESAANGRLDPSRVVAVGNRSYFHTALTIDRRKVGGGQHALHVFYPQQAWREARWEATWPGLAIGAVAMALVAAAAYVVAHRVTRPIGQLRSQVARIAEGDFRAMPIPPRDDEVQDLARAVNQMALKLAEYEDQTRKTERLRTLGTLGGGIAHQIRNAATGCRIALDLHQRDCPQTAANGHSEEPLAVAARQLELIESHIQRFLALGRPAPVKRTQVDLTDVIEQALALVQPTAVHSGAAICFEPPEQPIIVVGDSPSLVQMLVNLLVNAVQAAAAAHAIAGGTIAADDPSVIVRLEDFGGGKARIAVGDCGPGPAAAIRARLFEPFATDKPGGTGLGLVVARQVAEDHGGSIRWERRDEWTWFLIELPTASDGAS